MNNIPYEYHNCPIPGGGYVTGFLFSKMHKNLMYIRTDIGGTYKYDFATESFSCLSEYVDMFDLRETFPAAIALSEDDENSLFIMSGINSTEKPFTQGLFSVSKDCGKTYEHYNVPFFVHGNLNGRGTGERLICKSGTIYYASQKDGLWYSEDYGKSFVKFDALKEDYLTAVYVSEDKQIIIVGSAGVSLKTDNMRGPAAYISKDGGISFEELPLPKNIIIENSKLNGYVPHRFTYDDKYLYMTLNCTGFDNYVIEMGYSCDSGTMINGTVLRYDLTKISSEIIFDNITPNIEAFPDGIKDSPEIRNYGFGGISVSKAYPGLIALGTIGRGVGDEIYISKDYGKTYEVALYDLSIGNLRFNTSYMKPCYNGGHSLIHWLSDVRINPFDADEVWFNTGTGVFRGREFTKDTRYFEDVVSGIEETVHLNVYSLPKGPVKVLDIVGDLGGFAFKEPDEACDTSFSNENGDRYITCINADYSDIECNNIIVSARGNWKGKTKGGLIYSRDYGQSFQRLDSPFGISEYTDTLLKAIETPNVNPGWVSLSADTKNIVWNISYGIDLYLRGTITSTDGGKSFTKTKVYDLYGNDISYKYEHFKVYSDSVKSNVFYGFGDRLTLYISTDCGLSFKEIESPICLPNAVLGLIDTANKTEIKRSSGQTGIMYGSFGEYGLLKFHFDAEKMKVEIKKLTSPGDIIYRMGLGILPDSVEGYGNDKTIYVSASLNGKYGFYRSVNDCKIWEKINENDQNFGEINSIAGDMRTFGTFYIATGSFGLKYGREIKEDI